MMWFPSQSKVLRELNALISRMEKLDRRIAEYEVQQEFGLKLGMPKDPQVAESREAHSGMFATLLDARMAISTGELEFREIAPQLKSVSKAISHMEWILDEADKDSAHGKRVFRERFGGE